MAAILSLVEHLPENCNPQPAVIETLEELLAEAKAGRITAIAAAVLTDNGRVGTTCPPCRDAYRIIGAVSVLLHELQSQALERPESFDPPA